MKVLVCGGRHYIDRLVLNVVLSDLHKRLKIDMIIEGDAKGADRLAGEWAIDKGIENKKYKANWAKYGRGAGPVRNMQMLVEGKPDFVVAFPGGIGTANMIKQARNAGVEVREIT